MIERKCWWLLMACAVLFAAVVVAQGGTGPVDGPAPPPGSKTATPDTLIECLSADVDGAQLYEHLEHPIKNNPVAIRAAFLRYGQDLELKAIATGDHALQARAQRLARIVLDGGTYETGGLCACVPIGVCGCSAGCGGPWCVHVTTKRMK